MSIFNMTPKKLLPGPSIGYGISKKIQKTLYPVPDAGELDPGAPPEPVALPVPSDPSIRAAELAGEKAASKRRGRASTLMSGQTGDSIPAPKVTTTLLGGY